MSCDAIRQVVGGPYAEIQERPGPVLARLASDTARGGSRAVLRRTGATPHQQSRGQDGPVQ